MNDVQLIVAIAPQIVLNSLREQDRPVIRLRRAKRIAMSVQHEEDRCLASR